MKEDKMDAAFTTAVCMIPMIEASMKQNWLPTLLVLLGVNALTLIRVPEKVPRLISISRVILIGMTIPAILDKSYIGWPGKWSEYIIPILIVILASVTAGKGETKTVVMILRYGVYGILFLTALSAIKNINITNLYPRGEWPSGDMVIMAAMPLLIYSGHKPIVRLTAAGIMSSIVSCGYASLYHFSRSLSISGAAEHIESVISCILFVGYYGLASVLLEKMMTEMGKEKAYHVAIVGGSVLVLYISGIRVNEYAIGACVILLRMITLFVGDDERKRKKVENRY